MSELLPLSIVATLHFFLLVTDVSSSYLPCTYTNYVFDCVGISITFDRIPTNIPKDAIAALLPGNKISSLTNTDFVDRGSIQRLTLNDNEIEKVAENALSPLLKLQYLTLDNNEIKSLDFYLPYSLEHINLKSNDISYISPDILNKMRKLQTFDVSQNRLTRIPEHLFKEVYVGQQQLNLDFSNNQIETMSKDTVSNLIDNEGRYSKLKINLAGNPLRCNCLMKWIAELHEDSSRHSVSHIDIQGTCTWPENKRSRQISSLKASEFLCTPPEIDATVRTHLVLEEHDYGMIPCSATGDPTPEISFKLSNGLLLRSKQSKGKYSVNKDGMLIIDKVSIGDAQRIQCIASNVVKNTTIDIIITVNQQLSSREKTKIVAAVVVPLCIIAFLTLLICCLCTRRVRKCCRPKRKMRYTNVQGKPVEDYRFPNNDMQRLKGANVLVNSASLPNGIQRGSNLAPTTTFQPFHSMPRDHTTVDPQRQNKGGTMPRQASGTVPAVLRTTNLVVAQPSNANPNQPTAIDSDKPMASRSILFRKMSHPYVAAGTVTNGITVPAKLPATPLYIDPPEFEPRTFDATTGENSPVQLESDT